MSKSKLTLSGIKKEFTSPIERDIIKAVEAEQRASKKHLPLIKKVISSFINSKDEVELLKARDLYRQLHKLYRSQSYKQYASYLNRASLMEHEWAAYMFDGIDTMKRDDIAAALFPVDPVKTAARKTAEYKKIISSMLEGVSNKVMYLNNMLDNNEGDKIAFCTNDEWIVRDAIYELQDSFATADSDDTDNADTDDTDTDNADTDDTDDTDTDNADTDDTDDSDDSDDSDDTDTDDKANERSLRVDYIIEKLALLDLNQLDRVVSFLDTL